jgi:GTP diphosphokinase / guanosine-3',5'-bis(diphosphate) 3'-diphosphatase
MIRINDILDKVSGHHPNMDLSLVERAYIFSAQVHAGQVRLSGEPYLSHPLEVAYILAVMGLDPESIASALLHDVIEDTHATEDEIREMFGPDVQHIVSGVTKLSVLPFKDAQARQAESIRKMLLAMADDIRVILIKLADRLHNMRTLNYHKKESKKVEISQETLDIYAPIAARLGIYWIKNELENIAFSYIDPEEYKRIDALVNGVKPQQQAFIENVKELIQKEMAVNQLSCEVKGRYKTVYSVHQKMLKQNLPFEEIYDIIAFRIIVSTLPQCYAVLGVIHALWKPIDAKFKDYIGRPKPNMYQSLHTTVVGPSAKRIEIQIRTHEMDQVAKSGIAAHWSYKEGKRVDDKSNQAFAWIQNLVENQKNINDPAEFLENVRIDLFPDEVYVFTPNGEVKTLPKGATPIDFAYAVHSQVGHECVHAVINGRMMPLKTELKTGDQVAIITQKNQQPSKDWLNFVKTVKARSRIRQWIKTQEKDRSISLGREMCEKAFRKYKLNFNVLAKSDNMTEVVEFFGFKTLDDLVASVGYGKTTPLQIIRRISPKEPVVSEEGDEEILDRIIEIGRKKKSHASVLVKGVDDILVRIANCCQPVPGDAIIGYITHGSGVAVHRINCINALKMNPERQIEVDWNEDDGANATYPARIHIRSVDRVGLLADLAANITKEKANIINANSKVVENQAVEAFFTVSVGDTNHLNRVLASLRKVKHVVDVRRID